MMPQALVFTLAAPFASFGAVAVGERRPTWDRPGKSQVIGLLAAALGIPRVEEQRLDELARDLHIAIRVDDPGQLATDYHTTQVPPQRRNRSFATRAEELAVAKHDLKTILSRREFRVGSRYSIAVWYEPARDDVLAELKEALARPRFAPYAGRKAFPLMLPMSPMVVEAGEEIERSFATYDQEIRAVTGDFLERWLGSTSQHRPIFVDADVVPSSQLVARLEERRDVPESRAKWRFGLRAEALLREARPTEGDGP